NRVVVFPKADARIHQYVNVLVEKSTSATLLGTIQK
ncbi:MAG: TRAM domain-containing protein, partial [Bacteroidales bacterium]|nr:TRAM domain-containing protein [Bacteroidales bacterium]